MSDAFELAAGLGFRTILRRIRGTQYGAALVFKAGILISMVVPLLIYFMHTAFTASPLWQPFWFLVPLIGVLSGTHVFATTYLYVRPGSFRGVRHRFLLL